MKDLWVPYGVSHDDHSDHVSSALTTAASSPSCNALGVADGVEVPLPKPAFVEWHDEEARAFAAAILPQAGCKNTLIPTSDEEVWLLWPMQLGYAMIDRNAF